MPRVPLAASTSPRLKPWVIWLLAPAVLFALVLTYEANTGQSLASKLLNTNTQQQFVLPPPSQPEPTPEPEPCANVTVTPEVTHQESESQGPEAAIDAAADSQHATTDQLQQWKLMHSMMYWAHSHPVPKPSHGRLFPAADEPQYITWEQDFAGLNNVRLQVEVLVVMAHLFRRTLVMPDHLAEHMDHLAGYQRHTVADFFDFRDLSTWVPVITMQQYLDTRGILEDDPIRSDTGQLRSYLHSDNHTDTVFPKWDANSEVLPVPNKEAVQEREDPSFEEFSERASQVVEYTEEYRKARTMHFKMTGDSEYRLFGNCAGFWYWPSQGWQDYYMAGMRDHFHFHRDIVANASRLAHHLTKKWGGPWNALHDRVDDFQKQFPGYYVDEQKLTEHLKMVLGDSDMPLYIAVAKINATRWAPVLEAFPRTAYLKDIVGEVLPGVPPLYLGPIEQVLCSVAQRFVGTFGSTFTGYIHRLRGHHHPGLVPDKGVFYTNYPFEDHKYASTVEDNEPWANIVWWPRAGRPTFDNAMWARDFSLTWDFHNSESERSGDFFDPVRRRQLR